MLGNWFPEWAVGIYFCNSSLTMSFTRYTIFTFKMYSSVLFVFFQTCATISTVNFRVFHDLEKKPAYQLSFSSPLPYGANKLLSVYVDFIIKCDFFFATGFIHLA